MVHLSYPKLEKGGHNVELQPAARCRAYEEIKPNTG